MIRQNMHNHNIAMDVKVAKELRYPAEVIAALKAEKDPNKRTRILREARLAKMD